MVTRRHMPAVRVLSWTAATYAEVEAALRTHGVRGLS